MTAPTWSSAAPSRSEPSIPDGPIPGLVDRLFRRSAARIVAALTRRFGPAYLDVAEEVVQEALLKALQIWPHRGVPERPDGWLFTVARNLALDRARRDSTLAARLKEWEPFDDPVFGAEPAGLDDELAMIFLCCHPALPADVQVALTLKTVGGFGVEEIAGAFLAKQATIAQRLVRAKRVLRDSEVPFAMPSPSELPGRLEPVLATIYLLFTEGYGAHSGTSPVRTELTGEAIRLVDLLARHPSTDRPEVHALAALLCFQASRLPARVAPDGELRLLEEQERARWDRTLIARGFRHLERAADGDRLTPYHLEAGIAAAHAAAPSPAETDWRGILDLYDRLATARPSPVVALNRAVALAEIEGPAAALADLEHLRDAPALLSYYLLPATRGALLHRLGRSSEAAEAYAEALALARTEQERGWLRQRIANVAGTLAESRAFPRR